MSDEEEIKEDEVPVEGELPNLDDAFEEDEVGVEPEDDLGLLEDVEEDDLEADFISDTDRDGNY